MVEKVHQISTSNKKEAELSKQSSRCKTARNHLRSKSQSSKITIQDVSLQKKFLNSLGLGPESLEWISKVYKDKNSQAHAYLIKMLIASDKFRQRTNREDAQASTKHQSFAEPDEHSVSELIHFLEQQVKKNKADIACNRNHARDQIDPLQVAAVARKRSLSSLNIDRREPGDSLPSSNHGAGCNLIETRDAGSLRSPRRNFQSNAVQENMAGEFKEMTVTLTKKQGLQNNEMKSVV